MTARQLFDWASTSIPAVHFGYCTCADYGRELQFLERRFQQARTIPGTRKLHIYIPVSRSKVRVRLHSSSDLYKEERVTLTANDIPVESITGFVICLSERTWWLACVVNINHDTNTVRVTCLYPHGPCTSFRYPRKEDIRLVHADNILMLADPKMTRRVYTITKTEMKTATDLLTAFLAE